MNGFGQAAKDNESFVMSFQFIEKKLLMDYWKYNLKRLHSQLDAARHVYHQAHA